MPAPGRTFTVEAGLVTVEVLGTEFDVWRAGERVEVAVLRGTVAVHWLQGSATLSQGQRGTYPPPVEAPQGEETAPRPAPSPRPREAQVSPPEVPADVESLLDAADDARRGGALGTALGHLRRIVHEHPKDPRAPLAAFTMGRIELERGRNEAAARHFAMVRSLGGDALAEHALAREVEAWSAAGKPQRARAKAEVYLKKYPGGPRASQVRRVLEAP